ncbi:MAG: CopG family transcriptional regulator [Deltaproteobacteria bacterium]|nr:MAG: CopG family transcriptional regulator [Deltaproteobacteria bacterium]
MKPMTLRLDPKMAKALELAAKNEISSVSQVIRRAVSQYLRVNHQISWEKVEVKGDEP